MIGRATRPRPRLDTQASPGPGEQVALHPGEASPPCDRGGVFIVGRKRIAFALKRSERTVTRWLKRGILPTMKAGPYDNNLLMVRRADVERLAAMEEPAS